MTVGNQLYPLALSRFAKGEIDYEADTIRVYALDVDGVFDPGHEFADDLDGVLDFATLASKTVMVGGVCDAADFTFTAVTSGQTIRAVVVVKWVSSLGDSPLIAWADENDDGTPIAYTSTGAAIPVSVSDSADRLFRL